MDKTLLEQYVNMRQEVSELEQRIERHNTKIVKLENQIATMENGEVVVDKVYGGEGGIQGFKIEGFPTREYSAKKSRLMLEKINLEMNVTRMEELKIELLNITDEVSKFIYSIPDAKIRRIICLKWIDDCTWGEVSAAIGENATEDSVRMAYNRFMEQKK
jgi:hypothetical protein